MNKIIFPDANEQLYLSLQGQISTVIIDDASFSSNVKKAASSVISRQLLEELKPDKDHFLIHLIALGDDETYGFNKNADGFPKKANEEYHKTFEKYAYLYRNHNSSDKKFAIGQVKKAMYNPEMKRVEIAAWGNIKLAQEEYEDAKAGKSLSFSMGTRVPYDRDNISGKLCKTPSEYEPWMKTCPGKYIESWDGKPIRKWAYVKNDKPEFFDISVVKNPADRIAQYLQYAFNKAEDTLYKAASENDIIPSAYLPDILGYDLSGSINNSCIFLNNPSKKIILKKLASAESDINNALLHNNNLDLNIFIKNSALNSFDKSINLKSDDADTLCRLRSETLFYEMAKRASVLSFTDFMNFFYKNANEKAVKYASEMLIPSIFRDLVERDEKNMGYNTDSTLESVFDAGNCEDAVYDLANTDKVQKIMDEIEDKLSIDSSKQEPRLIKIIISKTTCIPNISILDKIKTASNNVDKPVVDVAKNYADAYAMYKIAALHDISRFINLDYKHFILAAAQDFIF